MPLVFCDYDDCKDSFFVSPDTAKGDTYCEEHRKSPTDIDETDKPFRSNEVGFNTTVEFDEDEDSIHPNKIQKETPSDGESDSSCSCDEEEKGEGDLNHSPPDDPHRITSEMGLIDPDVILDPISEIDCTITIGPSPPTSPKQKLEEGAETYESKNEDYGESWRQAGEILWKLADEDITVESEEEAIQLGLYFQRLHKITRSFNGEFGNESLNNESVLDSHEDEMVYAAMSASISEEL